MAGVVLAASASGAAVGVVIGVLREVALGRPTRDSGAGGAFLGGEICKALLKVNNI